jgi:hypothetical protein
MNRRTTINAAESSQEAKAAFFNMNPKSKPLAPVKLPPLN